MAGPPADPLFLDFVSLSPLPAAELAIRAATVLDAAGELAPERGHTSARTRALPQGGLTELVSTAGERRSSKGIWIVHENRRHSMWGDLRFHDDLHLPVNPRFHSAELLVPLEPFSAAGALRDSLLDLACDLFVAMQGFYGRIDSAAMRTRRTNLRTYAAEDGRMWLPPWEDPTFVIWDRWVEDVWWVNLFGPAYVERWGRERLDGLGVWRRDLPNGGIVLASAESPPDPRSADTIGGYPHKRPFYEALGVDTFIHESAEIPPPGQRVPTLAEHQRHTG